MAVEKIVIPDFGDVQEITVVEIFIHPGDSVEEEDSLIALESEKAVMDIPSPFSGVIKEVLVKEDDQVKSGDVIALIEVQGVESVADGETAANGETASEGETAGESETVDTEVTETEDVEPTVEPANTPANEPQPGEVYHATPSVRAYAREQGVDLAQLVGSGPRGRIVKDDVLAMTGGATSGRAVATGTSVMSQAFAPAEPLEDFSKYGDIEERKLGRIQKISGTHLHKSWLSIPHVTHFDEADISGVESFRKELNLNLAEGEPAYSPLVFITRAVAATLKQFPLFNCSLVPGGESVILKHYYHIAIAVDTPNGLVVPVIKNADSKGFQEIAAELKKLSTNARAGKLAIGDMQGATFTISSLGGIGGTGFTPIVSSPQVAILGLSRSYMKPVWDKEQFLPRLTLPFSVSYDHRVIDGAEAARFCKALRMNIEDLRRTLL
jgi:pyruvate dehydrogenase E2 component (dihydrolipoamide acetyltransferase)